MLTWHQGARTGGTSLVTEALLHSRCKPSPGPPSAWLVWTLWSSLSSRLGGSALTNSIQAHLE